MDKTKRSQYQIELLSLPEGNHCYHYDIDGDFFAGMESDDVHSGDLTAEVEVIKSKTSIEVRFEIKGVAVVSCDRCLGMISMPVDVEDSVFVRFGAEYFDDGSDTIVVSEADGVFDLSWLMYEYIVLALPAVRMHEEGECDSEMIKLVDEYSPENQKKKNEKDEVDPRWAALKNINN